jgi:hypothetical protein
VIHVADLQDVQRLRPGDLEQRLRPLYRILEDLKAAAVVADSCETLTKLETDKRQIIAGLDADLATAREKHKADLDALAGDLAAQRAAARSEIDSMRTAVEAARAERARAERSVPAPAHPDINDARRAGRLVLQDSAG